MFMMNHLSSQHSLQILYKIKVISMSEFLAFRYKVYRLTPDDAHMDLLELTSDPGFDFWKHPRQPGLQCDVMVAPDKQRTFQEFMVRKNISYQILLDDVER